MKYFLKFRIGGTTVDRLIMGLFGGVTAACGHVVAGTLVEFLNVQLRLASEVVDWVKNCSPWVGWLVSFICGLYVMLYFVNRILRYRAYRYLNVNTGHFYSGGRMYYRADPDGPLYRVDLRKTKGTDLAGSLLAPEYDYSPVGGSFLGFSESTLAGSHPVKRIPHSALPQGIVVLFDGETVAGVGWRYENTLVTARHLAENASELWVQGAKSRVRVNTCFTTPPRENYENTGADIASAEIPQSTWSQIGSKCMKRTQLSARGSGRVRVYGADAEGIYESFGDLVVNGLEQSKHGTVSYKVSTLPGFSGSPVILRTATGGVAIVGMHICGDYAKNGRNHGACAAALSLHLNGTITSGNKVTLESVLNETSVYSDNQEMFSRWEDLEDFTLFDKEEVVRDLYHDDDAWDREDRDIRGMVHGYDDEDGYDSDPDLPFQRKNDSIRKKKSIRGRASTPSRVTRKSTDMAKANLIQRNRTPRGGVSRGKRMKFNESTTADFYHIEDYEIPDPEETQEQDWNKDPHEFEKSDFLSPPEETPHERVLRQAAAGLSKEAKVMKDYQSAVETFAPELTPVLTGFLKGECAWATTTTTPGNFEQPQVKKRDATPEDIDRLFTKLYQGDHTAFTEATGFTYASLVDAPPSRIQDPFQEFRNYRDHTRSLIDSSKKTGQVMEAGDGKPFFKHIGKAKGGNPKKARVAPLRITDEEKALLKELGVEGEFVFPPNDEKSIQNSMASQAKKQSTHRGLPLMELMLDEWTRALNLDEGEKPELKYGGACLEKVFASFDETSSGWTRRYRNLNKKTYVAKHAVALAQLGFGRLLARASMLDSLSSMTPEEMVHYGLRDPVELFVKEECHNQKKTSTSTWRLICNISLADCLVQAYLGNGLNKQQIRDYQTGRVVSHTCGMGHHDEGIDRLGSHIENLFPNGRVVSTDASGWDMSVSRDAIMADATRRCLTVFNSLDSEQAVGTAIAIMADKLITSCHVFVSGKDVWSVEVYGLTASGLPDTTSQNSFMRGLGAIIAGSNSVMCAGDDLLSSSPLNEGNLKVQGTITKEGMEISNWMLGETVSFTSHSLTRSAGGKWSSKFENVSKCFHRLLLTGNPNSDQLGGVAFAMRNDDTQLHQLRELCKAKGWEFPDKSDWSMDGEVCA